MRISATKPESGFTLIEIAVVLLILVALAGLTMPYISGTSSAALCKATDVSMQNVKKAIMERYYLDTLGYFPKNTKSTANDYNLKYLFIKPNDWSLFDPATQTGWRPGGYLQGGTVLSSASTLHSSFWDATTATPPHVNANLINGDIVVLDGWGRPIILQVPSKTDCKNIMGLSADPEEGYCARLVSAGAGTGVNIGDAIIETPLNIGRQAYSDDRILYLNASTPAADINPSCDE